MMQVTKHIHISIVLVILTIFLVSKPANHALAETLTFATTNFAPFSIHNDLTRKNAGFIIEIVHEAFLRHGYNVRFQFLPTERAQRLARSGVVTGSFQSTKPKEDKEQFFYSRPFNNLSVSYFTLKNYNGPTLFDMEDGRRVRIATTLGSPLEQILTQLRISHATVRSEEFGLKLLMGGRIDAFLAYTLPTEWVYQRLEIGDSLPEIKAEEVALYPFYLTIHKNNKNGAKLIRQFNDSISIMKRDGSYHHIMISYVNYLKP
ncbi:substrate-binding periplasmic protein [Curvivirga sp.]|uniref:substrate-binding periplasmic protein n=1 Tax=Curvivirga sp. TaxID=2856848 RepID=UPI003B5A3364